jgi:putative two-component system response regulator
MARLETLERLALAGEYRDDNTHEHAQRVGRSAARLAEALGRPAYEVELLRRAAPLHDIGKIGVPDAILLKPGKLDRQEYELMKSHARIGHQILSGSGSRVLRVSAEIALTHHERWDGSGYPAGLEGEEIPLGGRITAVGDVFDALMHRRPYKDAWALDAALAEIRHAAGRHFDPAVVEVFEASDPESLLGPIANGSAHGRPVPTPARVIGVAE